MSTSISRLHFSTLEAYQRGGLSLECSCSRPLTQLPSGNHTDQGYSNHLGWRQAVKPETRLHCYKPSFASTLWSWLQLKYQSYGPSLEPQSETASKTLQTSQTPSSTSEYFQISPQSDLLKTIWYELWPGLRKDANSAKPDFKHLYSEILWRFDARISQCCRIFT